MQEAQYVPVWLALAVQIWTPWLPLPCVHKRMSFCMQGQVALMLSFQAQTLGVPFKQVEVL